MSFFGQFINNLYFEIVSPMRFDLTATPMSSCCIDEFFYFCTAQPRSPHDGSFADFDRGIVLGVARLAGQSGLPGDVFLAVSNDSLKHEPHLDLGDGTHDRDGSNKRGFSNDHQKHQYEPQKSRGPPVMLAPKK